MEDLQDSILLVRDKKVILDNELAMIYGVSTRVLNQAVSRNPKRFPKDFCFQLEKEEYQSLMSQNVIPKPSGRGGRRTMPYAFTEHGALMAASVLQSDIAIDASIKIVRAFIKMRKVVEEYKEMKKELGDVKQNISSQGQNIRLLWRAIEEMNEEKSEDTPRKQIGFNREEKE